MRFRGTAVLFVLLAGLAAWVYWTDIYGREERERAEAAAGKALALDADEIEEIGLMYPDTRLEGRRSPEGWEFVFPPDLEADAAEWERMASDVPRIERGETVSGEPADLSPYGLDVPEVIVEVRMADGGTEQIRFGTVNPAGTSRYTSLGSSPEVFLTPVTFGGLFLKEADDLRDRTLLRFAQAGVERIQLIPAGVSLTRESGEWFIDGAPRLRADDVEVASFLSALETARATGFADDREGDVGSESARVVLSGPEEESDHVLVFGSAVPDAAGEVEEAVDVYVRDASRSLVVTAEASFRDRVLNPASFWRDKTIAIVDPASVTRIEIVRDGETIRLDRSEDSWRIGDGESASGDRIEDMLTAFDFQEASGILDDPGPLGRYGLAPPRVRVVFADSGGSPLLGFGFGDATGDGSEVYWKSDAEDSVKQVPQSVFAPFDLPVSELAETVSGTLDP